jgi:hypothetical protein
VDLGDMYMEDVTVKVPARHEWDHQLAEWGYLSRPVARQFGWAAMRVGEPLGDSRDNDMEGAAETIANILRIFPRDSGYPGAILARAVEIANRWEPMDTVRMGPHEWGGVLRARRDPLE